MPSSLDVHVDTAACDTDRNKGRMIGVAFGAALAAAGHFIMKKQLPQWATPGSYQGAKIAGALGLPAIAAYLTGESYYKDCRARNFGMNPPRIATSAISTTKK